MQKIQLVMGALARARTVAEIADTACRMGSEAMEADAGGVWLLQADGSLALAGSWGRAASVLRPLAAPQPGSDSATVNPWVQRGEPTWVESAADEEPLAHVLGFAPSPVRAEAFAAIPLGGAQASYGLIAFVHVAPHRYDSDERAFYLAFAQQCVQALERARLLDAERKSNERLRLLATASETLAQSLDLDETLRAIARLTVPAFADWCLVDLVIGDEVRNIAMVHSDPEAVRKAEDFSRNNPARVGDGSPIARVVADSQSHFRPHFTDERATAVARNAEELEGIRNAGVVSAALVPLKSRSECIGVLTVLTAESGRVYDTDDLHLAEGLGRAAGLAIANARLYREVQDAAQQAQAAATYAEQANRVKDEFLATVSHELRTPLNAILGWSSLITQKAGDPPTLARGLQVIRRNALAQARLVDDILDVSRIVSGKMKIDLSPIDMVAIVRDAVDVVRPSAEARNIALLLGNPEAACPLVGDASRLQQVVWNLLSNAVKFTGDGGSVSVRIEHDESAVAVTVTDDGCGIEPSFLPYVFDRFKQADSSPTRRVGGLGLGLAIVRRVVELHGGQVSAQSAGLGKGAAFRFVLPIRATAPALAVEAKRHAESERGVAAGADLEGARILVVDDELETLEWVEAALMERHAIVKTASSAQAARDTLAAFQPDLIVSDIGMPGEDGCTFISGLRNAGNTVPAIAVTAYARPEDRLRAVRAGFSTHMPKPIDANELAAAVANLIGIAKR